MGHLSLPASKRNPRQWKLLDLGIAFLLALVFLFFVLIFTRLGDSLAASGRQSLLLASGDHARLVAAVESGKLYPNHIESCPEDYADHMPCEDPRRNSQLSREMNFYRERHCPLLEETPLCLVPPPEGYKIPVQWPASLDKIWHSNMPHNKIADRKGHQGWMKVDGPYFIFPGGGTMFPDGAGHYIEKLKQYIPITGGALRTALDMGCGFLETGPELGSHYNEVIASQDVATYGGLCALASFDRMELKNKVIDNVSFRNFLELVPEVRELINDFYSSHYASCLEYLGNLKPNLLLDIHLHDHVETLYDQIRHKALIQYTHPFVSVDLHMMANAFRTSVAGLEKELEALITDNQIQARIDSHNKILYARHADQRNATFQRVLQTGREFDRDVRSMLLRANLIKYDHNLRASRKL